jgi:3-oxoacyl-(acyl-carrier-protein) synthase
MCGLSISALIYAADLVRCGRQKAMIAVASDEKSPLMAELYQRAGKILAGSSSTIMAGDSLAEGAAAVIMEPVDAIRARGAEVLARITAVERGSASKMHSGADQTQTVADMLRTALAKADLQPDDIGGIFVTRHDEIAATKTLTAAISTVFRDDALPIASTDDLIGHCPASTDFFNIVAATESLRRGCMPARNALTATRPVRHVVVFCHSMFNDIACIVLSGGAQ